MKLELNPIIPNLEYGVDSRHLYQLRKMLDDLQFREVVRVELDMLEETFGVLTDVITAVEHDTGYEFEITIFSPTVYYIERIS